MLFTPYAPGHVRYAIQNQSLSAHKYVRRRGANHAHRMCENCTSPNTLNTFRYFLLPHAWTCTKFAHEMLLPNRLQAKRCDKKVSLR